MTLTIGLYWIAILALYTIMAPWKWFVKAGRKEWEGYIPLYNIFIWLKVIKRPWWWGLILLIPGFGLLMMSASMNVSMGRFFGKYDVKDTLMQIFLPFIYFPMVGYGKEELVYEGETDWKDEKQVARRKLTDQVSLFLASFGIINVLVMLFKLTGSKEKKGEKTMVKEWGDSIVFAIIAAALIRGYVLEAFTIPTPSMEKELLVGDYMFVNKIAYGTRVPLTPISYPLVHNTIPFTYINSYSTAIKLPYYRVPGYANIERNDIVVFNHPVGDTAIFGRFPGQSGAGGEIQGHNYFQILRQSAFQLFLMDNKINSYNLEYVDEKLINKFFSQRKKYEGLSRKKILEENLFLRPQAVAMNGRGGYVMGSEQINTSGFTSRPIDKKENYIKRCVAIPGDTLQIKNGELFINSKPNVVGTNVNFTHRVYFNNEIGSAILKKFKENYGFNIKIYSDVNDLHLKGGYHPKNAYSVNMSEDIRRKFVSDVNAGKYGELRFAKPVEVNLSPIENNLNGQLDGYINFYPNHKKFNWTVDNYGPIWMPKEGATIDLTPENWILYKRCITVYEGNQAEIKNNAVYINGKPAKTYTFKQNYYYMVGDNRHNSADSRMWGFVPEDHVVGRGLIIWMSKDVEEGWFSGGVRWERIFKTM